MIFRKPDLKKVFPEPPMAALRQPPNLRRMLCRSYLYSIKRGDRLQRSSHKNAPGWHKCGSNCPICPFTFPATTTVTGLVTGYKHQIKQPVNCKSDNIVYYWKCSKPNCKDPPKCEYIGLSGSTFQNRFSEHK